MIIFSAPNLVQTNNIVFPLLGMLLCILGGLNVGASVDQQYREPEGKPHFIEVPHKLKWLFRFRHFAGAEVVKVAFYIEVVGYVYALAYLCMAALAWLWDGLNDRLRLICYLLLAMYVFSVVSLLLPMAWRYERNKQKEFQYDWITYLQEALSLYPKRRCRIIAQIDDSTYRIRLAGLFRTEFVAKSQKKVAVNKKMYAVHQYELGFPFWIIKDH